MKKSILILSLIASVIITTDLFAKASKRQVNMPDQRGMRREEMCPEGVFFGDPEAMKVKLGLSDDQVDKIALVNLDYKKKLLKIREILEPKKIKLRRLLCEDSVNIKEVRALLEEMSVLEVEIRMLRINQQLDIEKILSPAQKNKLKNSRGMMGWRVLRPFGIYTVS